MQQQGQLYAPICYAPRTQALNFLQMVKQSPKDKNPLTFSRYYSGNLSLIETIVTPVKNSTGNLAICCTVNFPCSLQSYMLSDDTSRSTFNSISHE
jgi:hypothetical protein